MILTDPLCDRLCEVAYAKSRGCRRGRSTDGHSVL